MWWRKIAREDVDALLESLPLFERPGRTFAKWDEVVTNADGGGSRIRLPFPSYDADMEQFFRLVGERWMDRWYEPVEARRMLADAEFVKGASIKQVKSMLTYCARGEKFCDGHREWLLKSGQIVALLRRLEVIRERM